MPRTRPERYSDPIRATRTRAETARLVGCGINRVDTLIENGTLQAVEVGNRKLPTVVSIENLLGRSIQELEAPLRAAARPVKAPAPRPARARAKPARPGRRPKESEEASTTA